MDEQKWYPEEGVDFAIDDKGFARLSRHVDMLRDMANDARESRGLPPLPKRTIPTA